jgi:hypothetical protein
VVESGVKQQFFYWRIFANFNLKNMIFKLCKGFLMEKMTQIRQIPKKKQSELPRFYDKGPAGSQEYRRIFFFFHFHILYVGNFG